MIRTPLGTLAASLSLVLAWGSPAGGQVRKAPGAVVGDQVVVQLYVILADSANYMPVTRRHLDVRGQPDSLVLTTNDAGGATALLSPGPHNAVTATPVWWHGRRLTWSVPFDVHQGMAEVLLTLGNATVIDSAPHRAGVLVTAVAAGGLAPARRARTGRVFVDIDGATWEVFEEQLGGLAPAPGERPPDSLYTLVFHRDGHTRQLDAYPRDWRWRPDPDIAALFIKARTIEP